MPAQAHHNHNFARLGAFHLLPPVGMRAVDAAQTVILAAGGIAQAFALMDTPRVHAYKGQLAAIFHEHFKDQRRCGGIGRCLHNDFPTIGIVPHRGRDIGGRGQQGAHGIKHGLHTHVAQGRAAENGRERAGQSGAPQGCVDVGQGECAFQIGFHKGVVRFAKLFQQNFAPGGGDGGFFFRKGRAVHCLALIRGVKGQALLVHKVKHGAEIFALPKGDGHGNGIGLQALAHGLEHCLKICAQPVYFIDKGDLGNVEIFRLPPHGFRLRLNPAHGAENAHGPVQHAQGALHLNGEVHMARRVDEVDGIFAPLAGGAGRHDGDAAFLLLRHVVHSSGAVVHLAHAVDFAAVEKHALGKRGLARVDMGNYAYVADMLDAGHGFAPKARCF